MIRFLHAADIHLDSPLRGLERYEGAPTERIRGATRRALHNLIDLAIDERVDFVLVAGDLYDGDWTDYNTGLHLIQAMTRLGDAGIRVFLIQGNHDASNRMTRSLKLPSNVHLFPTDRAATVRLDDLAVSVHGRGFATAAVTEDLSASYPSPDPGHLNIGLLHTCAEGAEGHDPYAPCTVAGLVRRGYDYWALGHIHTRQTLYQNDEVRVEFPGNLQGRNPRETGEKGCLLVTVEPGRAPRAQFHRLDVVRWEQCDVAAGNATSLDDLAELAASALARHLTPDETDRLLAVRVNLVGPSPIHDQLASDPRKVAAAVRGRALELDRDQLWLESVKVKTRPLRQPDPETLDGPVAELLSLLAAYRANPARAAGLADELAELTRRLPHDLPLGDEIRLGEADWVAGLLDEVEGILRGRLLGTSEGR